LAAMMSGDMESLDSNIGKTSADYKEMAEKARAVQSIQESLQNLLVEMTPILKPLIAGIRDIVLDFAAWAKENKELVQKIGGAVAIFGTLMSAFVLALPILKLMGLVVAGIGAAFTATTAPILLTVGAIALLTWGIIELIGWFTKDIGRSTIVDVISNGGAFDQWGENLERPATIMPQVVDAQRDLTELTGTAATGLAGAQTGAMAQFFNSNQNTINNAGGGKTVVNVAPVVEIDGQVVARAVGEAVYLEGTYE